MSADERLAELIARYERGAKYDHAIDVLAALRELAAARQARADYAKANPLGGPASMFRVMAERIEAGEEYHAVLADYGLRAAPPVAAEGWRDRVGLQAIAVGGVWLRRTGDYAEVLVERPDGWRLCIKEHVAGNFSHIIEPGGIAAAPKELK